MGRKSLRESRRAHIVSAFGRVLADHGFAGATIVAVADEAQVSPGLLHHYFTDKQDMLNELLTQLLQGFRSNLLSRTGTGISLESYIEAALRLDHRSDIKAAKCWVGILAEALREPTLFRRVKQGFEAELEFLQEKSDQKLDSKGASALLSYILGSLVFGAFAPTRVAGFAADGGRGLLESLLVNSKATREKNSKWVPLR
jgi:AcrR family transcriptional regulator